MTQPTWRQGSACIVPGGWPAHVREIDQRGRAVVAFLGAGPEGARTATMALAVLSRPPGARHLDLSPRGGRSTKAPWTGEALRTLRREAARRPLCEVAEMVGRTEGACRIAFIRWWGRVAAHRDGRTLSLREVSRVLAVDSHRVMMLITRGYLRARRSGIRAGTNERWAISDEDLGRFLERHREHYDWRRMPPSTWRVYAETVNAADPLLTVDQVAARVWLDAKVVLKHIRLGHIPAVLSTGGAAQSGRRWLVRASALAGFTVDGPGEVLRQNLERTVHARGLLTVVEAARILRLNRATVSRFIREGRLVGERVDHGERWVWGVRLEAASAEIAA